jgi:geranylgeranyl pyrophosphate synthase
MRDWRAAQLEATLSSAIDELPERVAAACRRVIQAGGKRFRPELVIRCADVGPHGSEGAVTAAAAVELLHSASLVHDDLLDDADTRRGVVAIHRREGMPAAVIAGDALIALSWRLIAACDGACAVDLAGALSAMCDGQNQEDALRFRWDATSSAVVQVAALKTGSLLEAACRIGARLGGCTNQQVQALGVFGRELGVELQIIDDVLDVVCDDATLGKPTGSDFSGGILTLPTLFALAAGDGPAGRLQSLFVDGRSATAADEARSIVVESGAVARTLAVAREHALAATEAAASAGATELTSMPERYFDHQLRKVPAWCQLTVPANPVGSLDRRRSSLSTQQWGTERAG